MPKSIARRSRRSPVSTKAPRPLPRLRELPWPKILGTILVVGGIAAALYRLVDMEAVQAMAERLPGGVAFALLVVLPLVGFPASILHVAAGIRFGIPLGLTLVATSILIQLLASYAIVHRWRDKFERARWIQKVRARIPEGAHASVTMFTVLLPGAPFAAVNYVLPLIGVPLRTFILCALPLHTLRSTITVGFGDQSAHLTATRLAVLIAYALAILGVSWWMYARLQSRFAGQRRAAGDRKPRG